MAAKVAVSEKTALRFEYTTSRGETVYGRPLSPFVRKAILEQARELFPDPDVTPFIQDSGVEGLSPEHTAKMAEQAARMSEDYQRAVQGVENNRTHFSYEAVLLAGVIVDAPDGREAVIARYAAEVEQVRRVVKEPIADDWLATVVYCLIVDYTDAAWIYNAALQRISDEATQSAVRYFRVPV